MTTSTILVPAWGQGGLRQPRTFKQQDMYADSLRAISLRFVPDVCDDAIVFERRLRELPERLADVPMARVVLVMNGLPATRAQNGYFRDGAFEAEVTPFVTNYGYGHDIRVSGPTVEGVNAWFELLIQGGKNQCNPKPEIFAGLL